jgi:hypothetical protein
VGPRSDTLYCQRDLSSLLGPDIAPLSSLSQNKQPLTPTQVFQDVPSDHAFKTMTMETFPHSGQLLASVHPCKHASVMKKFIDRMDDARKNNSSTASSAAQDDTSAPTSSDKSDKKKKGWGIGGVVRKVTGGSSGSGSTSSSAAPPTGSGSSTNKQEDLGGVQVDFYMIIVGHSPARPCYLLTDRLVICSSSNSSQASSLRSRSITRPRSDAFCQ